MADAYLLKQKTIVGARYATWKMTRKGSVESNVESEVKKYFFAGSTGAVELQKLNTGPVSGLKGTIKDFINMKVDNLRNKSMDFLHDVLTKPEHVPMTVEYSVKYSQDVNLPKGFPEKLTVSSSHEVEGNYWDGDNTSVHGGFALLASGTVTFLKKIFNLESDE